MHGTHPLQKRRRALRTQPQHRSGCKNGDRVGSNTGIPRSLSLSLCVCVCVSLSLCLSPSRTRHIDNRGKHPPPAKMEAFWSPVPILLNYSQFLRRACPPPTSQPVDGPLPRGTRIEPTRPSPRALHQRAGADRDGGENDVEVTHLERQQPLHRAHLVPAFEIGAKGFGFRV